MRAEGSYKGVGERSSRRCPGSDARALVVWALFVLKKPVGAEEAEVKRKGLAVASALALLLLVGGWYFGSPYWTLWRMREAAEARDAQALAGYVDFETLRRTTKSQLREQLAAEREGGGEDPLRELGATFASALIGPAVDAMITPEALRYAFLAKGARRQGNGGAAQHRPAIDASDVEILRTGASEFRLRRKGNRDEQGDLVFRRHGLGWKLEEVRLPSPARTTANG